MAVLHQLEQKRIKFKALEDELAVKKNTEGQLGRLSSLKPFGDYAVSDFDRNKGSIQQLATKKEQRSVWQTKLGELDKSNIIELNLKLGDVENAVILKLNENNESKRAMNRPSTP